MRLFCDVDGVAADFDTGYRQAFGKPCSKLLDDVDWDLVRAHGHFYEMLPPMRDWPLLWRYIKPHEPTFLTGVPKRLLGDANTQKHRWLYRYAEPGVDVITCLSKDKCLHCRPGDVLIDDWEKYRHLWEAAGGIWVTHTDAVSTIDKLRRWGL
jgi:hypothetical protein